MNQPLPDPFKHKEHIIAVPSHLFNKRKLGFAQYELDSKDIIIAQRAFLENNDQYRQVMPMQLFTHKGKIWTYRRSPTSGEANLHGKVAVFAGGHWDITDLLVHGEAPMVGIINLAESLEITIARELKEEVTLKSAILSTRVLPLVICADDVYVDRHHMAIVYHHELDGELLTSNEDKLEEIGFLTPEELLSGKHDLETWTRLAIQILANDIPEFD